MWKRMSLGIGIIFLFLLFNISVHAERSYTIEEVMIEAKIDEEGVMHVTELFTYAFSGSFNGTTRSILSKAKNFQAFEVIDVYGPLSQLAEKAQPLTVEKEENDYKIYSEANDETKHVLYQYEVIDSVFKYKDTAELTYEFFDQSNQSDLHEVTIKIFAPEAKITEKTRAFVRSPSGEFSLMDTHFIYENDLLAAGEAIHIRFLFPPDQLSGMGVTNNKEKLNEIIKMEEDYIYRLAHLDERLEQLSPIIWILLLIVGGSGLLLYWIHPNRYRGQKTFDELIHVLEETDPLFMNYVQLNENFQDQSLMAALFSLRRRGKVKLTEVPSIIHEEAKTFRFTWLGTQKDVGKDDAYLHKWLFTDEDEEGKYFLLDSILDNPDELETVREEKSNHFRKGLTQWKEYAKQRESFQGLKEKFHGYSFFAILFTFLSFGLFYYQTGIQPITPNEELALSIIGGVLALSAVLFHRNKWLHVPFYLFITLGSLIMFVKVLPLFLMVSFFLIAWMILLVTPHNHWNEECKELNEAIKKASHAMGLGRYPMGTNSEEIEQKLEYAILLGVGEDFTDQFVKDDRLKTLQVKGTLLSNPVYAYDLLSPQNLIFYSAYYSSSDSFGQTTSSTSSTGGGGAGAF